MGDDVTESLYDRVADLPVVIEAATLQGRSVETSYGFTRPTTVVSLSGAGETGVGEDVTTDPADHDRFQREGIGADLTGRYTLTSSPDGSRPSISSTVKLIGMNQAVPAGGRWKVPRWTSGCDRPTPRSGPCSTGHMTRSGSLSVSDWPTP
jgi:hypothetical protein